MRNFDIPPFDPRLAGLLADYPADLFNERLYQSIELADRYCLELAIDLLHRLGVAPRLDTWCSVEELCRHFAFSSSFRIALAWLLERLVASRLLSVREHAGTRHYRSKGARPPPQLAELRELGLAIDPANVATLNLLDAAAAAYPSVAQGKSSGEEAIFGMGNIGLWLDYFHNQNPLYAINNWNSARVAAQCLAGKPVLRIIEIGAGAGSGTEALLRVLAEQDLLGRLERYLVTEPNPFFRRRGQRGLQASYPNLPLEFGALNIDKPWVAQGVARAGFDLVYGVNALHVANNLMFSLGEARATLAPAGWLVAGECLRSFSGQPIYIELVFQILDSFINVATDPELRPNPGFLTPEQWHRAFAGAGFAHIQVKPDYARIREIYPRFCIGAVCGR